MSKKEPSLEDLGLDTPVEKPFGKAFDNYDSSKEEPSKTWVDSVKTPLYGPSDLYAAILAFFFGPVGLWYKGCWSAGFAWLIFGLILAFLFPLSAVFIWIAEIIYTYMATPKRH